MTVHAPSENAALIARAGEECHGFGRHSAKDLAVDRRATLTWVERLNNRPLLEPIGKIPPAEAADRYNAMQDAGKTGHGDVTQTNQPPASPGRLRSQTRATTTTRCVTVFRQAGVRSVILPRSDRKATVR